MANTPRVREQHIAVFGESGSGKTVLVSSFFGPTQVGSYSNELWDLVADDTGQSNRLYKNYLGMRDRATAPMPTRFAATSYTFSVKLKDAIKTGRKQRPFDVLRLVWHDYPGEWFEESPSSDEESRRRVDIFRSLLNSNVAILLVDGQKLLDYRGEEERYLKSLMGNFRQGILRLEDDLLTDDAPLVEFPRIWILALSKADLFPDWDVNTFRDLIIRTAADDIERLGGTLRGMVDTPSALSIGEDFMLLSSARFQTKSDESGSLDIDVEHQVGLNLILPVASILPLERRVQWNAKMDVPRKVLDTLADGAEHIAGAIADGRLAPVEKLLARAPKIGAIAANAALPLLVKAVQTVGPRLKEANAQAREQGDYLKATLTQFKIDLEDGVANKVIRSPK